LLSYFNTAYFIRLWYISVIIIMWSMRYSTAILWCHRAQCSSNLVKIKQIFLKIRVTYFREHWCCLRTTELIRQPEVIRHRILCQTESFSVSFDIFPSFPILPVFRLHYTDTHQPPISGICLFFWTITNRASFQSCTQLMTPIRTDATVLGSYGCVDSVGVVNHYTVCWWKCWFILYEHVLDRLYWYSWRCRL